MQPETKNNPNILFHYTSIGTLLDILSKQNEDNKICFRATHAKFLNDPSEYQLAVSLLKQSMINYENENSIKNGNSTYFNDKLIKKLTLVSGNPFILSFSANADDLSMWRSYGADGKGVAIGLDRKMLEAYANNDNTINTRLLQCIYNKQKIINKLTTEWGNLYNEITFMDEGKKIGLSSFDFFFDIINQSFSFKEEDYCVENEWRLCTNVTDNKTLRYRNNGDLIVPYIEHYFNKEIIKKITVGPCVNKELSKESIEMFVKSKEYQLSSDSIIASKISYRQI